MAQYEVVKAVAAAHGDKAVEESNFEWSEDGLYIRISRPLAREDLTWLMLTDTLEGLRVFFRRIARVVRDLDHDPGRYRGSCGGWNSYV